MATRNFSADYLRSILSYDPSTGVFVWKKMLSRRRKPGSVAGNRTHGYVEIGIHNKSYRAHHLAWLYVYGRWPHGMLDHIDGDRANNAIVNLREASNQENSWNRHDVHSGKTTSQLLGVTGNAQRECWQSQIKNPDGGNINLGLYDKEEDAHIAYLHAKRELHPGADICDAPLPPKPERRNLRRQTSKTQWVSFDRTRQRWCAKPKINGKYVHRGYFMTEEEAAQAVAPYL